MLHRFLKYTQFSWNAGKHVVKRTLTAGPRSGLACAKTNGVNACIRVQNKINRKMRVECPCCDWAGHRFLSVDCGVFVVPDAVCPRCGGHERHRMMHLFLSRRPPEFMSGNGTVVHFAPEPQVRSWIARNANLECVSTDYSFDLLKPVGRPCVQMDLHHLAVRDECIDGVFCLHVLEHVADDRVALAEIERMLTPGGQAVIMVPFMMDQTATIEFDEPDPYMFDHVRGYSPLDFKERLMKMQFEEVKPNVFLSDEEIDRYRIPDSQVIYVCGKSST